MKYVKNANGDRVYTRADGSFVVVWWDRYLKLWTAFVTSDAAGEYQAGPAEYGVKEDIETMVRYADRSSGYELLD